MAVPLTASNNNTGIANPCPYRASFSIISNGVDDTSVTFNHGVDFSNLSAAFANLYPAGTNITIWGTNANATQLVVTGFNSTTCTIARAPGVASIAGGVSVVVIERPQVFGW